MSPLTLALLCASFLSAALFYKPLVLRPITAAVALRQFYKIPPASRRSDVMQAVSREWWGMVLIPVYALSVAVLIAVLGGAL
jgi:hypothetical protein